MRFRWNDPVLLASACAGLAGLGWLLPLMFDQMVFFADQEQAAQAERSMVFMLPAAGLVILAAVGLWARSSPWHGLLTAAPAVVPVTLAWAEPDALYQLRAYGLTAPLALGAVLSAVGPSSPPLPRSAFAVAAAGIALLAVIATPYLALVGLVAALVWWRLAVRR